ncbi:Pre-mRNA-splicing factor sap61 [Tilletia horrida]|uniref:Pre-mRNA-splicing factor sap61 n=1 Tax=Tilletia horrida TaxID=155126 RepID=A0AAN6GWP6_9BASI|nr:Pre-mRNA-splicing factor sap61 [Tilletia horrida]KAK0556323.1 Pre-mRNA-splicing factor sap61 [Tilletia horrida]KAK0569420.1 Pre-mRNA-splicing factor sap61 [Tilletia horrida]
MSTGLFEVARQTHEEIERYEVALADLLLKPVYTHKDKLRQKHLTSEFLDRITSRNRYLVAFYDQANTERADELKLLSSGTDDDMFTEFDARLKRIRTYHDKYPTAPPGAAAFRIDLDRPEASLAVGPASAAAGSSSASGAIGDAAASTVGPDFLDRMFSGEEAAGKYLDLYPSHTAYINLKGVKKISYLKYIDEFDKLLPLPASSSSAMPIDDHTTQDIHSDARIPLDAKRTDAYRDYLTNLQSYLLGFLRKTQPLLNVDALEQRILRESEQAWEDGTAPGWNEKEETLYGKGKAKGNKSASESQGEGIWCEACAKFFSKSTVYEAHLKAPKHGKAAARIASGAAKPTPQPSSDAASEQLQQQTHQQQQEQERRTARAKQLAHLEHAIVVLGEELGPIREETKSNVERKAALTERERQAEAEAAELEAMGLSTNGDKKKGKAAANGENGAEGGGEDDDDEDEDDKIYNPLKLPLGWDGKPIPFWLYKLHGLGVEYKCEICSDHVYQGRKNFEKHFQESRHAFGMRALGLPNTKHFHEITRISDALALAERLKKQGRQQAEEQGEAEEVEDEYGNTYTKKTYELLKRQGLI